ncbi:MAG: hypothetical protein ACR2P7_01070 [bacterium]
MNTKDKPYSDQARWEDARVKQLSAVHHLILGLSVAALGFVVSLLFDGKIKDATISVGLYWLSIISFGISIGFGVGCAFNRLIDFRKTARREKLRCRGNSPIEVEYLQILTDIFGKITWFLLWCQIAFFGVGIFAFVCAILLRIS